ncbi:MAG: type II toxin-antitoxin system VapC family toxin [Rhodoferax sp.]|nr:type II toxin-antitoxin system VapC family toxin [Rhodoferax sp.]
MNVVDSSGWIEYLMDSDRADLFASAIEADRLLLPTIALFEVHRVLSRSLSAKIVTRCLDVMRLGRVLDLTTAAPSRQRRCRDQLAMADAAMYSMAHEFGATFWTQDVDYKGLPGVKLFLKP